MPLAATWLMMSLEGPFLAAIIARLTDAKFNLAAYGVAFSFALIIEAPIIMIMSASTALVGNRQSYDKMRYFAYTLNAVITGIMILFLIPPIFNTIAKDLIGLPEPVARLTYFSTMLMLPWPAAIGFRRFYQGIMIRYNRTRRVAYGTVIRLLSMLLTALLLYLFGDLPGAYVGALALSAGVVIEAVISRLMVSSILKALRREEMEESEETPLTFSDIIHFYYPLALTSILGLAVQPMITLFIGHSRMALDSLAVLPVINSLIFIFRSMGLSYQEVGIALIGSRGENYKRLRNFAFYLAGTVTVFLSILAFTGLADFWFRGVSGLTPDLAAFSILPTQILTILPGLAVLLAFERSIMVSVKNTRPVTGATGLEVSFIIAILVIAIYFFNSIGVIAAALALVIGRLSANIYLLGPVLKVVRRFTDRRSPGRKAEVAG